jgi:hypothetical protein
MILASDPRWWLNIEVRTKMGVNVFANGMEVSAKKSDNQSIAAMPDICLSPPSPPAGPVPIPYPNFSQASDTSDGTKTVKFAGQEAGIKNESSYSTSKGDEAATRSFGMGTVTHTIQGKTKFAAWSMDVKFEGSNACRFGDITTHNHANMANSAATTVSKGKPKIDPASDPECKELEKELQKAEKNDTASGKVNQGQVMATGKYSRMKGVLKSASQSLMKNNMKPSAAGSYCSRPERPELPSGKTTEPNVACTDSAYNNWTCNSGHAEGKIIQSLFDGGSPSGSLTLRVKWNDAKTGKTRQDPCPACKSAICKTAAECDLTIYLCEGKEGKPLKKTKAPCTEDGAWQAPAPAKYL